MTEKLLYEIVSPEKLLASAHASQIVVPGIDGDFGVLAGHAPFMSTIRPGIITILDGPEGDQSIFVKGGLAQVSRQGLTILAEETLHLDGINLKELSGSLSKAYKDLLDAKDNIERDRIQKEIDWMVALQGVIS